MADPTQIPDPRLESLLDRHDANRRKCGCCRGKWAKIDGEEEEEEESSDSEEEQNDDSKEDKEPDNILRHTTCGHEYHESCIQAWLKHSNPPTCPACRAIIHPYQQYDIGDFPWKRYWRRWAADKLKDETMAEFLARPGRQVQYEFRIGLETARVQQYNLPLREAVRIHDEQVEQCTRELGFRHDRINEERLRQIHEVEQREPRRPRAERYVPRLGLVLATIRINETAHEFEEQSKVMYQNRLSEIQKEWEEQFQAIDQAYRKKKEELRRTRIEAIQSDRLAGSWFEPYLIPELPLLRIKPNMKEELRWETLPYSKF